MRRVRGRVATARALARLEAAAMPGTFRGLPQSEVDNLVARYHQMREAGAAHCPGCTADCRHRCQERKADALDQLEETLVSIGALPRQ